MRINGQIGIVGAGPAGARAAERLALAGAEVVLFDPHAPWEKPCGGGLTAAALENVPDLGELCSRARRIEAVRLETRATEVRVPLERPLYVLSRRELGAWQLARARRAGASFEPMGVRRILRHSDGWCLETSDGGVAHVRLLVGADGAASRVRAVVAPELRIELAPARVAYAPGAGTTPEAIGLRFFPGMHGYAWEFPRPAHRSIGVGVAPRTWNRRRLDAEVDAYWDALGRCGCTAGARAGAVIGTAAIPLPYYALLAQRDYALLGDAAGFADPATGEGIQNAIRSADFLAEAFERDGTFARYPAIARSNLEREFAVARRVRRVLYGGSLASDLIELAGRRRWAYALLAAVVNGGNAHDASLLRGWRAEWKRVRGAGHSSVPRANAVPTVLRLACECAAGACTLAGSSHTCLCASA